jgi:hypothetical protein
MQEQKCWIVEHPNGDKIRFFDYDKAVEYERSLERRLDFEELVQFLGSLEPMKHWTIGSSIKLADSLLNNVDELRSRLDKCL